MHEPAGAAHLGHRHRGREGDDVPLGKGAAAGPPEGHHDLPELQPADAADVSQERLLSHGDQRRSRRPGEKAGAGADGAGGAGRQGGRLSLPALRRPEAAGGHRPGPGDGPQGPAVRRGHLCPGPHHHRLHPGPAEGPEREAGGHRGGHHPPDERHRGDLLPGGHSGRRRGGRAGPCGRHLLQPLHRRGPPPGISRRQRRILKRQRNFFYQAKI